MTAGAVAGAIALTVAATATSLTTFLAGWVLAGTAMAATFYQAAFAALTRWYGPQRVRALTVLTLAGGLASTVFAPITAALAEPLGWRHTYLVLAAALLVVTTPLHWFALRGTWIPATHHLDDDESPTHDMTRTARSRPFILMAIALTMSGFAMCAVVFGLIPLLLDRGVTPTAAAVALGLGGLGQTLGRLLYAQVARHTNAAQRTRILILAGGATTALIALIPGPLWLILAAAMAAGAVRGNLTLLQATAVTDRWGTRHYARLTARLTAPVTIAAALAPWAGAALANQLGSYRALFLALAGLSVVAAAFAQAFRGVGARHRRASISTARNPRRPTAQPSLRVTPDLRSGDKQERDEQRNQDRVGDDAEQHATKERSHNRAGGHRQDEGPVARKDLEGTVAAVTSERHEHGGQRDGQRQAAGDPDVDAVEQNDGRNQ